MQRRGTYFVSIENILEYWKKKKKRLGKSIETDKNRKTLFKLGKWGPPTMTLSNSEGENLITVWGQDRIWLIEETIKLMQVNNN